MACHFVNRPRATQQLIFLRRPHAAQRLIFLRGRAKKKAAAPVSRKAAAASAININSGKRPFSNHSSYTNVSACEPTYRRFRGRLSANHHTCLIYKSGFAFISDIQTHLCLIG